MFALMVISLMTPGHNFAQERVRDCGIMWSLFIFLKQDVFLHNFALELTIRSRVGPQVADENQESNDKYQIPIIVLERMSGKCSITYIRSYYSSM